MNTTLTASSLFLQYQQPLALNWLAAEEAAQTPLTNDGDRDVSLVGHLNIIHPNQLQVIGPHELTYINSLPADTRSILIADMFATKPVAVIIANGLNADEDLRQAAQESHTPLLGTSLDCTQLISKLRHYLSLELAGKTTIHGVFLEVHGLGVLLTGESSVGKSELALELITRNHRLIADDAPEFSHLGPETIRGSCPELLRDFLEVRGLGLLNVRAMYGDSAIKLSKDLRLIVNLQRMADADMQQVDRLKGCYRKRPILDVEIPEVTIPVISGRNLAVLVEAAALDHILLRKGYNASEAFIKRQQQLLQQQDTAS